jgi:hypothetical protein
VGLLVEMLMADERTPTGTGNADRGLVERFHASEETEIVGGFRGEIP